MMNQLIMKWKNQEIGIGCGQHFIFIKNIMVIFLHLIKILPKFLSSILKTFFLNLFQIKKKKIFITVDLMEY